ncbi:MAG TPA: 4-(cytidine 5'-diphospho)-2-C-methyl-D-erythritol kinase [Bacteroidaceae bacterium]|nr:4-(cytidine 5'-diphospho)-2-C-methyl-D-erythritol kinase [Bacteroidaceae bacterium]
MITFPNSKINIGLNVIEKRSDGYHNIESVFYPVNLQDALEINLLRRPIDVKLIKLDKDRVRKRSVETDQYAINLLGSIIPGHPSENLVVKAYLRLLKDFDIPPIDIHLYKHIPSGAGLGGGSSDGAHMISLLNRRFGLRMTLSKMEEYASELGADCPFFIRNRPVLATGIGNIMDPIELSLKSWSLLIVKPNIDITTKESYANITPNKLNMPLIDAIKEPIENWKDIIVNDFEKEAFLKYPELKKIKEKIYSIGAVYASMTGSGSAIYGLFQKPIEHPRELFPGLFCRQRELM